MSLLPRPSGLPRRIPAWAWKALKLPGAHLPHRKPAWFWIWRKWRLTGKLPALTRRQKILRYAHRSLTFAGKMVYTEGPERSQLFHRAPGDFAGAHADCSQYAASILHWVGVHTVTDLDYTGTLLQKGRAESHPAAGRAVVWGPGTGSHMAWVTAKTPDGDWWTIGFGDQQGPDRVLLSQMNTYFRDHGKPGVRFLDFL